MTLSQFHVQTHISLIFREELPISSIVFCTNKTQFVDKARVKPNNTKAFQNVLAGFNKHEILHKTVKKAYNALR